MYELRFFIYKKIKVQNNLTLHVYNEYVKHEFIVAYNCKTISKPYN